jgi:hypothetical protein
MPTFGSGRACAERPRARRTPFEGGADPRARRSPLEVSAPPRTGRSPPEGGAHPRACSRGSSSGPPWRAVGASAVWAVSCMVKRGVSGLGFVAGFNWGFPSCLRGPLGLSPTPRTRKTSKSSPFTHGFGRGITVQKTTKGSHKFPPSNPQEKGPENNPKKSPREGSENHHQEQTGKTHPNLEEPGRIIYT